MCGITQSSTAPRAAAASTSSLGAAMTARPTERLAHVVRHLASASLCPIAVAADEDPLLFGAGSVTTNMSVEELATKSVNSIIL